MKWRIDALKACVAALTGIAFLTIGVVAASLQYAAFAAITLSLAAVYLRLALKNGGVLILDDAGVHQVCFGREVRCWNWNEISEYGVMGTRVFGTKKRVNKGTRYVYFSEKAMDSEERFQMCLSWPPKRCAYASYTEELMRDAKRRMGTAPVYYNTPEP